jgi:hypothetical protein
MDRLSGAFAGYPSGWTGYAVWVLGNTIFWVAVIVGLVLFAANVLLNVKSAAPAA